MKRVLIGMGCLGGVVVMGAMTMALFLTATEGQTLPGRSSASADDQLSPAEPRDALEKPLPHESV